MLRVCCCLVLALAGMTSTAAGQVKWAQVKFAGNWRGQWENSEGQKGEEALRLYETAEGLLFGTYDGWQFKGERVGENAFTFEGVGGFWASYRVVGRIEGGILYLNYARTSSNGKNRYYGKSVMQKVK